MDRSAAYASRWVAKSLVKGGLCKRVLVQVTIKHMTDVISDRKNLLIILITINNRNISNVFSIIQVSYAIGVAEPMSIFVDSYGTSWYTNEQLTDIVKHNFDLRPGAIVKYVKI